MTRLHLILSIQFAREEGFTYLAAALTELLRREIARNDSSF